MKKNRGAGRTAEIIPIEPDTDNAAAGNDIFNIKTKNQAHPYCMKHHQLHTIGVLSYPK